MIEKQKQKQKQTAIVYYPLTELSVEFGTGKVGRQILS